MEVVLTILSVYALIYILYLFIILLEGEYGLFSAITVGFWLGPLFVSFVLLMVVVGFLITTFSMLFSKRARKSFISACKGEGL